MVKYIGPKFRILRRLGKLFGLLRKQKKIKPLTSGEHGKRVYSATSRSSLASNYKEKLIEKQKLKFNYGLTEKQLYSYYKYSEKIKGSKESILFKILESRLDCIVFRLGFAPTIAAARQYINHCHILVNENIVNIPSFLCSRNDIISIRENSKLIKLIKINIYNLKERVNLLKNKFKTIKYFKSNPLELIPQHLYLDENKLIGIFIKNISRKDIKLDVDPIKVIEYYSR
jgi:small subunit ribosomal protein S4